MKAVDAANSITVGATNVPFAHSAESGA
jgi:hypothetical protein